MRRSTICLTLSLFAILASSGRAQRTWCPLESEGFGDPSNLLATLAIEYGGDLYVGTYNPGGAELWRFNGAWNPMTAPWAATNVGLLAGVVHQGDLVVGTINDTDGAEVWRFDGVSWSQDGAAGLGGGAAAVSVDRLALFGSELMAGLTNDAFGTQVRAYQGGAWTQVNPDGFGCGVVNEEAYGLIEYAGRLYVTTGNNGGCQVWQWDGLNPWQRVDPGGLGCGPGGFGAGAAQTGAHALEVLGTPPALWVGTEHSGGGQVWRYDGVWTQVSAGGFGDPQNFIVHDLAQLDGVIYASTENPSGGCEVWAYDGAWIRVDPSGGFGAGSDTEIAFELGLYQGRLVATTLNGVDGAGVWRLGLGVLYCAGVPNSSGDPAALCLKGSDEVADNDLSLIAHRLPPNQFGYFLAGQTQGLVTNPGGSQGNLCLGGTIARFSAQIQNSGPGGTFMIPVDLTQIPLSPPVAVLPGDSWNFQAWYRDVGGNSNFTEAATLTFL
jgi:hypothetical protein